MKKGTMDAILALVLIFVGVYAFFESATFPSIAAHFPQRIALLLVVLSSMLLVSAFFSRKTGSMSSGKGSYRNVSLLVGSIALYALILDKIGYAVSTVGLMLTVMYAFGYRSGKKAFLVSVCSVLAAFIVFRLLLGVPLPLGVFTEG